MNQELKVRTYKIKERKNSFIAWVRWMQKYNKTIIKLA